MIPIQLFWTAPNGRARIALRRYNSGEAKCRLPYGYHNASIQIGEGACEMRVHPKFPDHGPIWAPVDFSERVEDYLTDGRWPTACECGYVFGDDDGRQVSWDPLYVGAPDGRTYPMRELPVGAVYRAHWYERMAEPFTTADPQKHRFRIGPDGMVLTVVTPRNGDCSGTTEWVVDQRSSPPHGFWTRNAIATDLKPGDPVPLHCNPSIFQFMPVGFHGWVQNGMVRSA